jgi:hypothetical protein
MLASFVIPTLVNAQLPNDPYWGRRQLEAVCLIYPIDCEGILYSRTPGGQGFSVVSVFSPSIPPNACNNPDLYDTTQCNYAFLSFYY